MDTQTTPPGSFPAPARRKERIVTAISIMTRFGLAAVWLTSGFSKIGDQLALQQSIAAYELFTPSTIGLIALILPPVEIAFGVMVALGLFLRTTSAVSVIMFTLFIAGIISAWTRGLTIDCGCFGAGGVDPSVTARTYALEILRDTAFIAMAVWNIARPYRRFSFPPAT